ncbi:hypothetical protein [Nocardioides limicola]|uniref:hypothetical protein n=1 Tax=Nocardioides limicola TaxID=2803368 RepID=UPI00193C2D74|nr:hypothetical protein [Nocardioides sp. DJM-14]
MTILVWATMNIVAAVIGLWMYLRVQETLPERDRFKALKLCLALSCAVLVLSAWRREVISFLIRLLDMVERL